MTKRRRTAALLLLFAALALAAAGQYYFIYRRDVLWDGLVLCGLAVACFVLAWRTVWPPAEVESRSRGRGPVGWIRENPARAGLLALGFLVSLTATLLLQGRQWSQSTGDVVILWALGLAAVAAAALWPSSRPSLSWREWPARLRSVGRTTWLEVAAVLALTVIAFGLRAIALEVVPYTLGGDEAWHGLLARQVLRDDLRNPFVMGYMSMPTFFYWPLSWSLSLVGDTVAGLRFPAALVGALTVPVLYLFARDLWGRRTALLSAVFLTAYDYHLHYSRLGANNVWDPFFVVLVLWLLERGVSRAGADSVPAAAATRRGADRYFVLAGLVMGLSALFYTGARLLPLLVAGYLVYLWAGRCLRRSPGAKDRWPGWRSVALLILAFVIVAAPILSYALSHPDEWNARLNQVGIVQSGWLAREPELTGKSTLTILADQFLRAAGAFHVYADRTAWYGADRPLLGALAGIFALFGMVWALAGWRDRRYFLVLLWFWATIITGGMLTESPPSSQRLVIAIPAVALFVTFGLEKVVGLLRRTLGLSPRWEKVVLILLVLVMAAGSLRFYFVEFTPSRRYGTANGEAATMIGRYLQDQDGDQLVYFFGAPLIYWNFGTMPFLAPKVPARDVVEPLTAPPDFVDRAQDSMFIFMPDRAGELTWVQQAFPDGRLQEVRDVRGNARFWVYTVPAEPGN